MFLADCGDVFTLVRELGAYTKCTAKSLEDKFGGNSRWDYELTTEEPVTAETMQYVKSSGIEFYELAPEESALKRWNKEINSFGMPVCFSQNMKIEFSSPADPGQQHSAQP